ncbi:MAG: hypothetical protein Q7S79_00675 [bacterium]|nr:hypothetical protein [bacterium]
MKYWPTEKLPEMLGIAKDFIMVHSISIIWLIFVILFLCMAWRERQKAKQPMESLRSSVFKDPNAGVSVKISMAGIDFESFVNELEKANQESHQIAATAYLLAGVTAVVSFMLSFT